MKKVICDIETDGLQASRIWVCVCKDVDTKEVKVFRELDKESAKKYLESCDKIIGHNFIDFDSYWLKTLWNVKIPVSKIVDTLVLSRLSNSMRGGHSLDDWGRSLGCYKGSHSDWSRWSQEMEDYCIQDVEVNYRIYKALQRELKGFSTESIKLEHESQFVLSVQRRKGFKLNRPFAVDVKSKIDAEYFDIIAKLKELFPPREVKVYDKTPWTPKLTKDGEYNAVSKRILQSGTVCKRADGTYDRWKIEWREFSIDSPKEICERLKDWWTPSVMTPTGQPKVCEENLNTLKEDAPAPLHLIKKCKVLKSRSTLIQSYFDACDEEDRVHGTVYSVGAASHRMAHNKPNTGNIPSRGLYGHECRAMYTVGEGRKLVGCDAANIQLRGLCHYMQDENLRHNILHNDMHFYFSQVYGLNPHGVEYDENNPDHKRGRNTGKTCTFAIIMGGGVARVGQILGGYEKGVQAFNNLKKNCTGWSKFKKEIEYRAKIGYFIGLDGRKIPLKSAHFGMSSYLQSYESIIMKRAMVESYKEVKRLKLDAFQVAIVHDEFQYDCHESCAEQVGQLLKKNIIAAAEYYNSFCPLDGDYKIGNNWEETH